MPTEPFGRILRLDAVLQRIGLGRMTSYRWSVMGRFARQANISHCCSGWRGCAARDWLENPKFYRAEDHELWRGGGPSP